MLLQSEKRKEINLTTNVWLSARVRDTMWSMKSQFLLQASFISHQKICKALNRILIANKRVRKSFGKCCTICHTFQFSSVAQLCPTLCDTMIAALQASLSITLLHIVNYFYQTRKVHCKMEFAYTPL